MRTRLPIVACLLAASAAALSAVELGLDARALAQALDIGQSRLAAVRTRFHQPYRLPVGKAPIDYIEIVTPFRRLALAAETRGRAGDRLFSQREARALIDDLPGQIDLLVELTFHPQNTFLGVPAYDVRLLAAGQGHTPAVDPQDVERVPRFGLRIDTAPLAYPYAFSPPSPGSSQPLTGGTLIVRLDGRRMDVDAAYSVLIVEGRKEVGRARVDFRALR